MIYTMSPAERTAFVATLSSADGRHADHFVREAERKISTWLGYAGSLSSDAWDWALALVVEVSDNRICTPQFSPAPGTLETWDALIAKLRAHAETVLTREHAAHQSWFDEAPDDWQEQNPKQTPVDGKVPHPWGTLDRGLRNLLDTLTPLMVWQVMDACRQAGEEALAEDLLQHALGRNTTPNPGEAVAKEFARQTSALQTKVKSCP